MSRTEGSDPDESSCQWNGQNADGDTVYCERSVVDGVRCVVHSPIIGECDDPVSHIEGDGALCGARFQLLDLECEDPTFSDNRPIDLTGANIDKLVLNDATLSSGICLDDAEINEISARDATIEGDVSARGLECDIFKASDVTIEGDLELTDAEISDSLKLTKSTIKSLKALRLTIKERGSLHVNHSRFKEEVRIKNSKIVGEVTFRYTNFEGRVQIEESEFTSDFDCQYADFQSKVSLDKSQFESTVDFSQSRFGPFVTSFVEVEFDRVADFSDTVSSGLLRFSSENAADRNEPAEFKNGAIFDDANLRELRIDGVDMAGTLQITRANIGTLNAGKIDGEDITVESTTITDAATFERGELEVLEICDSRFEGVSDFERITIKRTTKFHRCVFRSDVDFEKAEFIGDVSFGRTRFGGQVWFETVIFGGRSFFHGTKFESPVKFRNSIFFEMAWFSGKRQEDPIQPAAFDEEVSFRRTVFGTAVFNGVVFDDSARFDKGKYGVIPRDEDLTKKFAGPESPDREEVIAQTEAGAKLFEDWGPPLESRKRPDEEISDSDEGPPIQFESTTFETLASFDRVKIGDDILFNEASIEEIEIGPKEVDELVTLHFEESSIASGTIEFDGSDSGNQYLVDFTKTRLGDVDLLSGDHHIGVFDQCRIQNTEFDGFNFIPHLRELRTLRWEIHHINSEAKKKSYRMELREKLGEYRKIFRTRWGDENKLRDLRNEFQNLQTTYQYAKTGANLTGQSEPASEFFKREMRYQTRNHLSEALSPEKPRRKRIVPLLRSLFTSVFGCLSKYGESGLRVLLSSGVIIVGYFMMYLTRPDAGSGLLQKFVFSLGAFASILTGDIGQNAGDLTALIASSEGFVGALMSALLLFTLTRSIHR